jgi:hypothetical protein
MPESISMSEIRGASEAESWGDAVKGGGDVTFMVFVGVILRLFVIMMFLLNESGIWLESRKLRREGGLFTIYVLHAEC